MSELFSIEKFCFNQNNYLNFRVKSKINDLCFYLDPRITDWPLLGSPFPMLSIIFSYIYFVKVLGPAWMKNKKPFQIEGVIVAYNILMVLVSALFFYFVRIQFSFRTSNIQVYKQIF